MAQRSAPARTEFAAALQQLASERNLDPQIIVDSIRTAIIAAYKKDYPQNYKEDYVYDVDLNASSGEARLHEVEGEVTEVRETKIVTAKKGSKPTDITPPGFGRIAAQTARQVILQKIREAEKSNIVDEYSKRVGQLVSGLVIRFVGGEVIVDIGKTEGIVPREDQVYSENYHANQRLVFYVKTIRDGVRGKEVVLSRSDEGLIRELFKREVPEVNNNSVEIKAIARDPGSRAKVAVYSHQSGVDPVGSCVGQKGVRVQAVINELNGEKLDIIQYSEDIEKFVAASLAPATGLVVKINKKDASSEVSAPSDQLALAIGQEGRNAKLAGRLTGLHIDISEIPNTKPALAAQPADPAEEAAVIESDQTTNEPTKE